MNPYKALDLPEFSSVDADALHRAYKRAASKAHPDRNHGDTAKMAEVNLARDILLNPERKRRFDELRSTGSGPLTIEEQAMMVLGNMFQSAISQVEEGTPFLGARLFGAIAQKVEEGRQKALEEQRSHPTRLKIARKLLKGIKCNDLLRKALEARVEKIELEITYINQQVELGNLMMKLMQSVEFKP
jgi:curved DNA-binding protein CbpA